MRREIALGHFREDLYHRLAVIVIDVPALNDRREDIPLLVEHFLHLVCTEYGTPIKGISEEAITQLQALNWTGNIRELRNVVERLVILGGQEISAEDVGRYVAPLSAPALKLDYQ